MRTAKEFLEIVEKLDGKSAKDSNYSLRDWFKDGGWVQTGGKYDGKPCAKQPGQTTKPYCRDPDDRAALDKKERNKRAAKKRREDPDPDRSGAAKIVTQNEEKDACYKKVKSRYRVWPSAYASGALVKCRKVGASNWGNKTEEVSVADRIKVIQDAGKRAADPNLDRKQVEKMRKKTIKVVKNMKEEHDLFDVVYHFLISENLTEQEVLDIMAHVPIDEIMEIVEEFKDLTPEKEQRVQNRVGELARNILVSGERIKQLRKKPFAKHRPRIRKQAAEILKNAKKKQKLVQNASDALIRTSTSRSAKIQKRIEDLKNS